MSTSKRANNPQNQVIKWAGAGFLIMMGIVIGSIINRPSNPQVPVSNNITPIYTSAVLDIASEFLCACGNCNQPNLEACVCDMAKQQKKTINDLLNRGYDRSKVIETFESMYGGRKT